MQYFITIFNNNVLEKKNQFFSKVNKNLVNVIHKNQFFYKKKDKIWNFISVERTLAHITFQNYLLLIQKSHENIETNLKITKMLPETAPQSFQK